MDYQKKKEEGNEGKEKKKRNKERTKSEKGTTLSSLLISVFKYKKDKKYRIALMEVCLFVSFFIVYFYKCLK